MLKHHGVEIAERLIRALKEEEVPLNDYENIHEMRVRIGQSFITQAYHQKRPHSALGYLIPPVGASVFAGVFLVARDLFPRTFTYVKQNQDPNRTIE